LLGNSDNPESDRFLNSVHTNRVNDLIKEIKNENIEESFSNLINDQQYSYPGYKTDVKGAPEDMETLLSSRRFLKVFQQFQSLPPKQANSLLDKFCKDAIEKYKIAVIDLHAPNVTSITSSPDPNKILKSNSLMGCKYMICASMLLAAHVGNCQKVNEQFNEMNKIVQNEKMYLEKNKNTDPNKLLISIMSLDHDCIVNIFMYSLTQAKNNSQEVITCKTKLDQKEIPIVKWDAQYIYHDTVIQQGSRQIEKETIIQNFIVYSLPRNDNIINYNEIVKLFFMELYRKR
jgi:hypothetical protein